MDALQIALIALRSVGTLFSLQGRPEISDTINKALALYSAGANIDNYLQEIAEKIEGDTPLDSWDDIQARIQAEVDSFLG